MSGIYIANNIIINTTGTLTISGTITKAGGTITFTAGTISHINNSTLVSNVATTFNTNPMVWQNVTFSGTNTKTLNSLLKIRGKFDLNTSSGTVSFAGTGGILVDSTLP